MNRPVISVILPAYNAERFISDSLDSIINQSFENFEILVLNDGSTDNTKDIILSKKDSRIRYFEHKSNLGIIKSLNKGLYLSKGDFIARMDADDLSEIRRLEIQLRYLKDNRFIDAVGTQMKIYGTNNTFNYLCEEELHRIYLLEYNTLAHPTILMRKERFASNNLYYDRQAFLVEDYKLWVDAVINGLRVNAIPEYLLQYRLHENQITSNYISRQEESAKRVRWYYALHYFTGILADQAQSYFDLMYASSLSPKRLKNAKELVMKMKSINAAGLFFQKREFEVFLDIKISRIDSNI